MMLMLAAANLLWNQKDVCVTIKTQPPCPQAWLSECVTGVQMMSNVFYVHGVAQEEQRSCECVQVSFETHIDF